MRTKTEHQQRVEKLMAGVNQHVPDRPTMPDERTRELRARLILEEALETCEALGISIMVEPGGAPGTCDISDKGDFKDCVSFVPNCQEITLEEIADGCADVIVVTTGTLSACGIADDSIQTEVDMNNLAKFEHRCPSCGRLYEDDKLTQAEMISHIEPMDAHGDNAGKCGNRRCLSCGYIWQSGYSDEHGKWIKPSTHKPPNIGEVLKEQTGLVEVREAERAL